MIDRFKAKRIRKSIGLTQRGLANAFGYSPAAIAAIEQGKNPMRPVYCWALLGLQAAKKLAKEQKEPPCTEPS